MTDIMPNDGFNISISAKIDEVGSKAEITRQLARMQEGLKANIKMQIDPSLQRSIDAFAQQISRMSDEALKQINVTKEVISVTKELDGTVQKVTQQYMDEKKVHEEIITTQNKAKQAKEAALKQAKQESEATKKRIKDLDNLGKKIKEVNNLDEQGNLISKTRTYQMKGTNKSAVEVTTNAKGYVTRTKEIENIKQEIVYNEKLIKKKEELQEKVIALKQLGQVTEKTLLSVTNSLNSTSSEDGLSKIERRIKNLNDASKERIRIQAEEYKNDKKRKEEIVDLEKKIKLYKEEMAIKIQNTRTSYSSRLVGDNGKALLDLENSLKNLRHTMPDVNDRIASMNLGLKQIQATAREDGLLTAAKHTQTFTEMLQSALVKFPIWMAASTLFYQSFGFFTKGISYVTDLNKALTEISIVTGKNQEQVDKLGKEYYHLALQMSSTTEEIAKASVEFYRQGLSQAEVMEKVVVATQYAKISSIEFTQAAEILTATVNSMGISIERASDVFSFMGDATATGADELGVAFQKVGGSAGALGVEFEKVASWLAVVSSRTRESARTIGDSIKSILARIQNLKERGFDSEDGTTYNQVSKALDAVGVSLTHMVDGVDQFRDFGIVMDELGAKWDTLTSKEKAYLSTTIAGTYQQARFLNLMEGYAETVDLYEQSLDVAGTTQQKFNLYQEGTEAHVNRLKTAFTGLYSTSFNSEGLRALIDVLTAIVLTIDKVVESVGFVPVSLGLFATGLTALFPKLRAASLELVGFQTEAAKTTQVVKTTTKDMDDGFGTVTQTIETTTKSVGRLKNFIRGLMSATLIGAAIALLGFAVEKLTTFVWESNNANAKFLESLKEIQHQSRENENALDSLSASYAKLSKSTSNDIESQQELLSVKQKLVEILPETIKGFDEEGNAIYATSEEVKVLVEEYKKANLERAKMINDGLLESTKDEAKKLRKLYKDLEKAKEDYNYKKAEFDSASVLNQIIEENKQILEESDTFSEEYQAVIAQMHKKVQEIFGASGIYVSETWLSSYLLQADGDFNTYLEHLRSGMNDSLIELKGYETKVADNQRVFIDGFVSINNELLYRSDITSKAVRQSLDEYAKYFTENNKITDKNSDEMLATYRKTISELTKLHESGAIDLSDLISVEELQKKIQEVRANGLDVKEVINLDGMEAIIAEFKRLNIPVEALEAELAKLKSTLTSTNVPIFNMNNFQAQLVSTLKEATDEVTDLNEVILKMKEGKSLTAKEVADLITKEESLTSAIYVENGAMKVQVTALEDLRDAKLNSYNDVMEARKVDLDNQSKALLAALSFYQQEGDAIWNLTTLKKNLYNAQLKEQERFNKAVADGNISLSSAEVYSRSQQWYQGQVDNVASVEEAYKRLQATTETVGSLKNPLGSSTSSGKSDKKSSSGSETKAEALERQNLTKELIKSYNAEYKISLNKEKNLELTVKNAKAQGDYNKAIEQTNKLVDLQKTKAEQLTTANKKINEEANKVRKSNKLGLSDKEIASWFDINGEATLAYSEYLSSFAKESEAIVNNSKLSEKVKKQKIGDLKEQQEAAKVLFDAIYSLKQAYNANVTDLRDIDDIIEKLQNNIKGFQDEIDKAKQKIEEDALKAHEKWVKDVESSYNTAIDAIKKYYETQRDLALESIKEQIEAEKKRHEVVTKNLDGELKQYQDTIDNIIEMNKRLDNKEDYESSVTEQTAQINELKEKRNQLALIDTPEAKAKREELDKQIKEAEKNLNKYKLDYQRQTTNQALEDLKDAKSAEIDEAKDAEDKKYNLEIERLDKIKKETEDYWNGKLKNEKYFLELQTALLSGNAAEVSTLMKGMTDDVASNMTTLGEGIKNNLIYQLQSAKSLIDEIKYGSASIFGGAVGDDYLGKLQGSEGTEIYDMATGNKDSFTGYRADIQRASSDKAFAESEILRAFGVYSSKGATNESKKGAMNYAKNLVNFVDIGDIDGYNAKHSGSEVIDMINSKTSGWEQVVKDELKRSSLVYFIKTILGDSAGASSAHNWAEKLRQLTGMQSFDTGGYTGDFKGGKVGILHEKEYILNQENFKAVLTSVQLAKDLLSNFAVRDFRSVQSAAMTGQSNVIKIENLMNIGNLSGATESNVRELAKQGANEIVKIFKGYGFAL